MRNVPISDNYSIYNIRPALQLKIRSKTIAYPKMIFFFFFGVCVWKIQEQEEQLEENIKPLGKKAQRTTEDYYFLKPHRPIPPPNLEAMCTENSNTVRRGS